MRPAGGWTGWLLDAIRGRRGRRPRLKLVERIALAPRQTLALVEAEGRRFLVAASAEGAPSFYPLDERAAGAGWSAVRAQGPSRRAEKPCPAAGVRASW